MIVVTNLSKAFGDIQALQSITAEIREGSIYGLIGTNGAGKSTFLRILSGIYRPDSGEINIDGEKVFENTEIKKQIFYISDDQYFFQGATPLDMAKYYASIYETFDMERFNQLITAFDLEPKRKINTFSKGMKKQVSVICGLAAKTKYLLCDETFDGLDPVMRQAVKKLLAADVADRNLTPIIASHNLRELEDICDHIGLLHKGGILLNKDLDDMKTNIHKIQCVLPAETDIKALGLDMVKIDFRGSLSIIIARGNKDEIWTKIQSAKPIFAEVLPLTLEEIFISETEVVGYDIKKLFI